MNRAAVFNPPLSQSIQPSVIIWNPLLSFADIVELKYPDCASNICVQHWNDGSCPSQQPRILHSFHTIVLLASAVYKCKNDHTCLAHDPRILELHQEMKFLFIFCIEQGLLVTLSK